MRWCPWTFAIISFVWVVAVTVDVPKYLKVILGLITFVNYSTIQYLMLDGDSAQPNSSFRCPCVPLVPAIGIISNYILCTVGVGKLEWTLFICFELAGVLFYFLYGFHNSQMPIKVKNHNIRKGLELS